MATSMPELHGEAEHDAGVVRTTSSSSAPRGGPVHAGPAAPHPPAGDGPRRGRRDDVDPPRRWPHPLGGGADRWGPRAEAGRGVPRAPRGALPDGEADLVFRWCFWPTIARDRGASIT